jgi:hypothetical protein
VEGLERRSIFSFIFADFLAPRSPMLCFFLSEQTVKLWQVRSGAKPFLSVPQPGPVSAVQLLSPDPAQPSFIAAVGM